jgi:peptide/nickel transport system substrate-binding protein
MDAKLSRHLPPPTNSSPRHPRHPRHSRPPVCLLALAATGTALVAACSSAASSQPGTASGSLSRSTAAGGKTATGATLVVGTTDKVYALDPAGAFDLGSATITTEIYATLLDHPAGSNLPRPSLAVSSGFAAPTEYKVTLKPGLKFANGDSLTSTDVVFSFERQLKIASSVGPSSLLYDLASVSAVTPATVMFHLKSGGDAVFPQILASAAGLIVDHKVFSATSVTPDSVILAKKPYDGPYAIASYQANQLVQLQANPGYQGVLGTPGFAAVDLRFYAAEDNLKLDLQQGNIDLAARTLTVTDLDSLARQPGLKVYNGAATGMQYLVFNFKTQPYGSGTGDANPVKALAVRQAVADLIDRNVISAQVYKGTRQPLYTFLPAAVPTGSPLLKGLYGNGNGGPDPAKARAVLDSAQVATPVRLNIQYNTDHYGAESADAFALIASQLNAGGLFDVSLQSTEWNQYLKQVSAGGFPAYELGWYGDFLDAEDFYVPMYGPQGFVNNNFDDAAVLSLIRKQATTTSESTRAALSLQVQQQLAAQLPIIPLLQISASVAADRKVAGVPQALDTGMLPFAALKPAT